MVNRAMNKPNRVAGIERLRYQAQRYLTKRALTESLIEAPVAQDLAVIATVPCYDEPTVWPLLTSLWDAAPPDGTLEVLLLVNASTADAAPVHQRNRRLLDEIAAFDASHGDARRRAYGIHQPALPVRHAGVGLARKLVMDEALGRLVQNRPGGGVICCLDADCRVDPDYWQAVAGDRWGPADWGGASIYFEHDGADSADTPIGRYELYLRYYRNALRWVGHPHAFHTVGSAMAVSSTAYAAVGGMNRRQAGEDFYFLKKLMTHGALRDIIGTTVRPANRSSHRVPFGTGRAVKAQQTAPCMMVPGLAGFLRLAPLFEEISRGRMPAGAAARLDPALMDFLTDKGFATRLNEIRANSASTGAFARRFFAWFDGLKVRQWLNYWCANGGHTVPVAEAAQALLSELSGQLDHREPDLAGAFRRLDKVTGGPAARFPG